MSILEDSSVDLVDLSIVRKGLAESRAWLRSTGAHDLGLEPMGSSARLGEHGGLNATF